MINPATGEHWVQQLIKITPLAKVLDNLPVGNVSLLIKEVKTNDQQ